MRKSISLLLTAFALVAFGCGDEAADTSQAKATRPAKAKKKAANEAIEPVAYHYDPTNKTDPFRSYIRTMVRGQEEEGELTPLQRFELSQLTVTGIVWEMDEPRALVEDPTGKGYIVPVGAPIGKNKGRIVAIEDNRVRVKETYIDHLNRATSKEVEMYMYQRSTGG